MNFQVASSEAADVHPPDGTTTAWFDISDLMEYLRSNDSVTGIQRVVLHLFNELQHYPASELASGPASGGQGRTAGVGALRFCCYDSARQEFCPVPLPELTRAISSFATTLPKSRRRYRRLARLRHRVVGRLSRLLERVQPRSGPLSGRASAAPASVAPRCAFRPGDILVELGAFWFQPHHVDRLVQACHVYGLHFAIVIHDLIPVRCSELYPAQWVAEWIENVKIALRAAAIVFAPSSYTLNDVEAFCREHDVPLGSKWLLRWGASAVDSEKLSATTPTKRVDALAQRPFVLMVGTHEARKNHELMVRVWSRLHDTYRASAPTLVMVGKSWTDRSPLLDELKANGFVGGRVVLLDDVGDAELSLLYDRCLFTVFPSRAEGWGLPVGESLCHGKVCVASNAWSIPEVGGDLVAYFDPNDDAGCCELVERYAFDAQARAAAERRIRASFVPPTWAQTAHALLAGLDHAMIRDGASPGAEV